MSVSVIHVMILLVGSILPAAADSPEGCVDELKLDVQLLQTNLNLKSARRHDLGKPGGKTAEARAPRDPKSGTNVTTQTRQGLGEQRPTFASASRRGARGGADGGTRHLHASIREAGSSLTQKQDSSKVGKITKSLEGEYIYGEQGTDECPDGWTVITEAEECENAATALGETWDGGSSGECHYWVGNGGVVRLDPSHGNLAKFVCKHLYAYGEQGADECPDGTTVITDAEECENAATALGETWGGGSSGECHYWVGNNGVVRLDPSHGNLAKFVCKM